MQTNITSAGSVLGVYISGYHITTLAIELDSRSAARSSYQRKAINSRGTANEIISSCCVVIQQALSANNTVNKIAIAMAGPFDYELGISYIHNNKKHEALYGLNVKQLIADKLSIPLTDICMLNDAASFLKGEVFAGEARGYQQVIGLTLGTGLGTAKLSNGIAEDAALWDAPFLNGIAEDYLSERWFLKRYYELSNMNVVDVKELATFYSTSNTVKQVFREFAANLALFTVNFVKAASPQIIVLSGDIPTKASDCFLSAYKTQLSKAGIDIPVYVSKLNTDAVLMGAATCWLSGDQESLSW